MRGVTLCYNEQAMQSSDKSHNSALPHSFTVGSAWFEPVHPVINPAQPLGNRNDALLYCRCCAHEDALQSICLFLSTREKG